jgi:hypothetical protein
LEEQQCVEPVSDQLDELRFSAADSQKLLRAAVNEFDLKTPFD